jgi:uncharacterized membrane protein YbhN (UPF0104 family)
VGPVLKTDPSNPRLRAAEALEEELAAALPQTQGPQFFPWIRRWALHVVPFILLAAAAYVLWREFRHVALDDILAATRDWGWKEILTALGLSASSFVLMGIVEWFGLRWAGAKVSLGSALWGSFMASGLAHTLGANLLVSGAVRARVYNRLGVSLTQAAATTLFNGFAFAAGLSTLAGVGLLLAGHKEMAATRIANPVADTAGVILLGGVALYVLLCGTLKRRLNVFGHTIRLPSWRLALTQMGIGAVDNAVAAGILWTFLPRSPVGFLSFVGSYAPSVVVGLISHVPGGVGVFEGSLSALITEIPPASLAAGFLGYRLAFFVLPLLLACGALALDTLVHPRR